MIPDNEFGSIKELTGSPGTGLRDHTMHLQGRVVQGSGHGGIVFTVTVKKRGCLDDGEAGRGQW